MFVMMPANVMTNARQNSPKSFRQVCRFLLTDTTLITGQVADQNLPPVRLKPDTTSVEKISTFAEMRSHR